MKISAFVSDSTQDLVILNITFFSCNLLGLQINCFKTVTHIGNLAVVLDLARCLFNTPYFNIHPSSAA
jgi:hypothetical protein